MIYDNGSEDVLYIDFYILFCIQEEQFKYSTYSTFLFLHTSCSKFEFLWEALILFSTDHQEKIHNISTNIYHVPWSNASEVYYCVKVLFNIQYD